MKINTYIHKIIHKEKILSGSYTVFPIPLFLPLMRTAINIFTCLSSNLQHYLPYPQS